MTGWRFCENKFCYMRNRVTEQCTVFCEPWNNHNPKCDVKKLYLAAQQNTKEAEKTADNEQSVKSICPNCKNRHCNKDRWMAGAIVTGCSGQK